MEQSKKNKLGKALTITALASAIGLTGEVTYKAISESKKEEAHEKALRAALQARPDLTLDSVETDAYTSGHAEYTHVYRIPTAFIKLKAKDNADPFKVSLAFGKTYIKDERKKDEPLLFLWQENDTLRFVMPSNLAEEADRIAVIRQSAEFLGTKPPLKKFHTK